MKKGSRNLALSIVSVCLLPLEPEWIPVGSGDGGGNKGGGSGSRGTSSWCLAQPDKLGSGPRNVCASSTTQLPPSWPGRPVTCLKRKSSRQWKTKTNFAARLSSPDSLPATSPEPLLTCSAVLLDCTSLKSASCFAPPVSVRLTAQQPWALSLRTRSSASRRLQNAKAWVRLRPLSEAPPPTGP